MDDRSSLDLDTLDFAKGGGLVTVVAQDAVTGAVLMVAHADREALERTIATGEMHYHSRTRGLWHKGSTSGHTQRVVSLARDCDGDAVLARIVAKGPACHTGAMSCFTEPDGASGAPHASDALSALDAVVAERLRRAVQRLGSDASDLAAEGPRSAHEHTSYTIRLLEDRNLRLKKVGEEAAELIVACADGDPERATEEMADLLYHALVALHAAGGSLDAVQRVLAGRRGKVGR